jgi:hypothetical protein
MGDNTEKKQKVEKKPKKQPKKGVLMASTKRRKIGGFDYSVVICKQTHIII